MSTNANANANANAGNDNDGPCRGCNSRTILLCLSVSLIAALVAVFSFVVSQVALEGSNSATGSGGGGDGNGDGNGDGEEAGEEEPTRAPTIPIVEPSQNGQDFEIDVQLLTPNSASSTVVNAFATAEAKWEKIITSKHIQATAPEGKYCNRIHLLQDIEVPDLLVFVLIEPIDGSAGVLAQAGPCASTGSAADNTKVARMGLMVFDEADINSLVADGELEAVVMHEMGHVVGFGTYWQGSNNYDLLNTDETPATYSGAGGERGNELIGGDKGSSPKVESSGGEGTKHTHWSQAVYPRELMSGFLNENSKLSALTVESLTDMGLTVNSEEAESYSISNRRLRGNAKDASQGNVRSMSAGDSFVFNDMITPSSKALAEHDSHERIRKAVTVEP